MRVRRRRCFLLLMIVMVLITSACGHEKTSNQMTTVKIGYLPITHAAPLYFEKEFADTYLNGVKLELVKFGTWIDLVDALNTGRIDGASEIGRASCRERGRGSVVAV